MNAIKCEVRIWYVGDEASKDSVLYFADSLNMAKTYLRDWLGAHQGYKKDTNIPMRYNGKYACVYIVKSR